MSTDNYYLRDKPRQGLQPTCYFRTVGKGRELQQWWTAWASREVLTPPEKCPIGEWRQVPHVNAQTKPDEDDL